MRAIFDRLINSFPQNENYDRKKLGPGTLSYQSQSKRQNAEEMGISRHTVGKIVWEYERKWLDANGECDMDALYRLMGSEPKFNTSECSCPVATDEIKGIIRKCL